MSDFCLSKSTRMKNFLLALVFISAFAPLRAQTSVYHPMLVDSNVWAVYIDIIPVLQEQGDPSVQMAFNSGYVNTIKDTVVDSLNYKMFYSRYHDGNPALWSLLREDTATQQVFLLSAGDTTERIIYDFSLSTGDSIWLDFTYQNINSLVTGWWYVDSTNTYMIDAGPRKALYLVNPNNPLHNGQPRHIQWIESVGCNISPLYLDETTEEAISGMEWYMPGGCTHNTHQYSTTCAWQDSVRTFNSECWEAVRQQVQFFYYNGDSCVFNLMGSVNDPGLGIQTITLMPNPADHSTTLLIDNNTALEFTINITNVLGQEVKQVAPFSWYAGGMHSIEIDLNGLTPGIYSVNLVGENGIKTVRLIVQ